MTPDVTPITKDDQCYPGRTSCPCGCGHVGPIRKWAGKDREPHVRDCPCRSCLGKRSKVKGRAKQSAARKAMAIPKPKYASQMGHEENYRGTCRTETKAGAKANVVWTQYGATERQSDAAKAVGDPRPFLATFMPDGLSDGLFCGRLSKLREIVYALHQQYEDAG